MQPCGYCKRYRKREPRLIGGMLDNSSVAELVPDIPKGMKLVLRFFFASSKNSFTLVTGKLGLRTWISITSVDRKLPEEAMTSTEATPVSAFTPRSKSTVISE